MALFKCKMCGGSLEINPESRIATCEYCGSEQTLPKIDSEKKERLYDRANHFRRINDYDKAMDIYENILLEDDTDAEAYWSLVLCNYGIEYVEDPSSHKRMPTVNRTQYSSIFTDENYKAAIENASIEQRDIYEREAEVIDNIQKEILKISEEEEDFDIFICYKELDDDGNRTKDSVLANDLYYQLSQEGFKVFYSRITLEDKLGHEYEPYIFAALNSSKVMIVLGTKPEYFKSAWVRNEWSRYLALIQKGDNKLLIPAYKDMDPYALPDELSYLQAQDMSKLGFVQDLIRGIKKVIGDSGEKSSTKENDNSLTNNPTGNANALLERGYMALEDGDYTRADEFFENVLNQDAKCAEAYLGKLLAKYKKNNIEELKEYFIKKDECGEEVNAVDEADQLFEDVCDKYELNKYFSYKKIEELFYFDSIYISFANCIKKQIERFSEEKNGSLIKRARQYGSDSLKKQIEEMICTVEKVLNDRLQQAQIEDEKTISEIKEKYENYKKTLDDRIINEINKEKECVDEDLDIDVLRARYRMASDMIAENNGIEFSVRCDGSIEAYEVKENSDKHKIDVSDLKDIVAVKIVVDSLSETKNVKINPNYLGFLCLTYDGRVVYRGKAIPGQNQISQWKSIKEIAVVGKYVFGLKTNGMIENTVGNSMSFRNPIVKISAYRDRIIALDSKGNAFRTQVGFYKGKAICGTEPFAEDVKDVFTCPTNYYLLKKDGTCSGFEKEILDKLSIINIMFVGNIPIAVLSNGRLLFSKFLRTNDITDEEAECINLIKEANEDEGVVTIKYSLQHSSLGRNKDAYIRILKKNGMINTYSVVEGRRNIEMNETQIFNDINELASVKEVFEKKLEESESEQNNEDERKKEWRRMVKCQYCGGDFKQTFFSCKCVKCGRDRDY